MDVKELSVTRSHKVDLRRNVGRHSHLMLVLVSSDIGVVIRPIDESSGSVTYLEVQSDWIEIL